MGRHRWLAVAFLVGCGGNSNDPGVDAAEGVDASVDAAPAPRMFGIDVGQAPGESYADAVAAARANGASFLPQAIDWSSIEAGPDDRFDFAHVDAKKWDTTGAFTQATGKLRYATATAAQGDSVRTRYVLSGALSAAVDATLTTGNGTTATLLVRFGASSTAGNRCSQAGDDFVALVSVATTTGFALAAATCKNGVFANDAVTTGAASAPLSIRRTATQILLESGTTVVATYALSALPAAHAGPGRVSLYAENANGAATIAFDNFRVGGTATWDVPSDRFVGDPDFNIPALLEGFHGPLHTPMVIILRTINTVTTELPSDLEQLDGSTGRVDMSRADIRARYHAAIDYLLAAMPSVSIRGFSVGNEIDGYLGSNATAWAQTTTFANDAIAYARTKLPAGTPIGITVTVDGLRSHTSLVTAATAAADTMFITYYPLAPNFSARDPNDVPGDIAAILAATTKPVLFIEAGYPSAAPSVTCPACTGSEAKQAQFFHEMFLAYDAHPDRIRGFNATWMTDASDAAVEGWRIYYGVDDPTFLAYLATLGIRSQTGAPKPAWTMLGADAHARGF
jgi:hypothetical protein